MTLLELRKDDKSIKLTKSGVIGQEACVIKYRGGR